MDHAARTVDREEVVKRALLVLLCSIASSTCGAEPLGRLFYTPAQRAQLDAMRGQKNVAPPPSEPEQPAVVPEIVKFDGIVRRSDGKTTVWINNRAINDGKAAGDLPVATRVRPDDRLNVTVPQMGKSIELKVGQSADVLSGTVVEPYRRARPDPKPVSAPPAAAKRDAQSPAKDNPDDENGARAGR